MQIAKGMVRILLDVLKGGEAAVIALFVGIFVSAFGSSLLDVYLPKASEFEFLRPIIMFGAVLILATTEIKHAMSAGLGCVFGAAYVYFVANDLVSVASVIIGFMLGLAAAAYRSLRQ